MLPQFPEFKKLELEDKNEIEKITQEFPPYSDYNFVSMYSWNTNNGCELSVLNDNLAVKFFDYVSGKPFYSFIGKNKINETVEILFEDANVKGLSPFLKLIPQYNFGDVVELDTFDFAVEEDPDNFDYIVSVSDLVNPCGTKFLKKRNYINRFKRENPNIRVLELNLLDFDVQNQIEKIFSKWVDNSEKTTKETEDELVAIKRAFTLFSISQIVSLGIYDKEELIGFAIDEVVKDRYSVSHFEKGDIRYKGIFEFIKQESAKHLKEKGTIYLNLEQDLGIEGLRKAKQQWNPVSYLKKYIIRRR